MKVSRLEETVAVLTGSSAGIALEIACQLAESGAKGIVLNGRSEETGQAALEAVRSRAPQCEVRFIAGDATLADDIHTLVDTSMRTFGRIDVLVNSVGGGLSPRPFTDTPAGAFLDLANRHFLSALHASHSVLPHMIAQEGGVILNMASDAGKIATPGETVIGALKAATIMFTKTLALEASRWGVRVHCLTPSIVRLTPNYDRLMSDDFSRKLFQRAEARALLGVTTPSDIARLAVFLASPSAANITGQVVSVNGGISAA
jgi:NAD(P)-dependent dehydrogenase (short-subunit alcohol dehydrogenase family)